MHQSKFVSSISNSGVLIAILAYCILIKFLFIMYAPPLPDEAYYWLWSKRIDFPTLTIHLSQCGCSTYFQASFQTKNYYFE